MLSLHELNYLSHYYFDHLPGEENHNFGLMIPDFVRNFLKGRKMQYLNEEEIETAPQPLIALGAHKHFSRDKQFHQSAYFKNTEGKLTEILKPVFQDLGIPRYYFASHLLTEMMIDRVLMKQEPGMLDQFYGDLSKAGTAEINEFLVWRGIEETQTFQERVQRFSHSQYLRQYVHNPALIYSLNRIYIYTGADQEWSTEQYRRLEQLIPEMESQITNTLIDLKTEMK